MKRIIKKLQLYLIRKKGVKIGNGCRIMSFPSFGSEPYLISIGNNVTITKGVSFINHDGGTVVFRNNKEYRDVIKFGKIEINDNCFIGMNSIIMPGVTIGKNCVIGAGSVVTKDIPNNSVAVGNPAKVIMNTEEYAKKSREKTPKYNVENFRYNKKDELINIFYKGV